MRLSAASNWALHNMLIAYNKLLKRQDGIRGMGEVSRKAVNKIASRWSMELELFKKSVLGYLKKVQTVCFEPEMSKEDISAEEKRLAENEEAMAKINEPASTGKNTDEDNRDSSTDPNAGEKRARDEDDKNEESKKSKPD